MVERINNGRYRKLTSMTVRTHRFDVGAMVVYQTSANVAPDQFKVTRRLPDGGQGLQYRIRSERDGHERVVLEAALLSA